MLASAGALILENRSSHSCRGDRGGTGCCSLETEVRGRRPYQRDDALLRPHARFAHHGVGLASAGLAVSKDADVVALEGVEQHLLPDVPVHPHLGRKAGIIGLWTGQAALSGHFLETPEEERWRFGRSVTEVWDQ